MSAVAQDVIPTPPWIPRPYQADAKTKLQEGIRRALLIWHRRAGKDNFALNTANQEAQDHVGTYWHLFPKQVQAKKAIWQGIDKTGVRFIDQAFPRELRAATRNQDMQIEFKNGSMWQLCGSDAYDRLVGANPRGVVFSEWALCDPRSWDYIRPIIRENGGWALFITTYRGRNHAYRMAQRLRNNPEWYVDVRTVDDTTDSDGRAILTPEDIDAERAEGMSEALIRQEYYCDPVAAAPGSIYGGALESLIEVGRMTSVSYDSSKPVFASWSVVFDNQYTVIFWQQNGNESRAIASKSFHFADLADSLQHVETAYPWKYISRHIVGPDVPGDTIEFFEQRPNTFVDVAPKTDSLIKIARAQMATTWIDSVHRPWEPEDENNSLLVDALNGFRFSKNAQRNEYNATRANTWEKHYATAFEVYAAWRHGAGAEVGGWHRAPSYENHDRAVI